MPIPKKHINLGTKWIEVPVNWRFRLASGVPGIRWTQGTTTEHVTVFVDPQKLAAYYGRRLVKSKSGILKALGDLVILRHERGG